MSFEEFCTECYGVMERVASERYGAELRLANTEAAGIAGPSVMVVTESSVHPTIHFRKVWQDIQQMQNWSVESIAMGLVDSLCVESKDTESLNQLVERAMDKEWVLEHLGVKIVNSKNYPNLEKAVYWNFLDLSAVCYVDLGPAEDYSASFVLTKAALDFFHLTESEVFAKAHDFLQQDLIVENILQTLQALPGMRDLEEDLAAGSEAGVYVITNSRKMFGAYGMLNKNILAEAAKRLNTTELIVVPSSIHEVLVLDGTGVVCDEINSMVQDVNTTLIPSEILSDHVYCYSVTAEVLQWQENSIKLV